MNLLNQDNIDITYYNYTKREGNIPLPLNEIPLTVLDLTLCLEGEMNYVYNGEHITLHSGDGILMLPGSFRERYGSDTPVLYASVNLLFDKIPEFDFDGYLPGCVDQNVIYMLDILKKDFFSASPRKNEKCLSVLSYIFSKIYETVNDRENPHIASIKQYILENIAEEITLDRISGKIHLAPQYICSLFKKETGMTITQYILKERIDLAKKYIITTQDSISAIAEACGFNDYCYFSHAFKKITGGSANQYRKINRL